MIKLMKIMDRILINFFVVVVCYMFSFDEVFFDCILMI